MSSINLHQILDDIVQKLMGPDLRTIRQEISAMIEKNNAALGLNAEGFMYRGKYYTNLDSKLQLKGQKPTLHIHLIPEFMATMKRKNELNFDSQVIKQALVLLVRKAEVVQDFRDALPECLVELIPLTSLPRQKPEAFTIADDERAMRQYMKVRDKIMYYNALRLIV